jgi:hypothetical protein
MWKVPPPGRERSSARTTASVSASSTVLAHAGRGGALGAVHRQEGLHQATAILFGSNGTTAPLRRMIW